MLMIAINPNSKIQKNYYLNQDNTDFLKSLNIVEAESSLNLKNNNNTYNKKSIIKTIDSKIIEYINNYLNKSAKSNISKSLFENEKDISTTLSIISNPKFGNSVIGQYIAKNILQYASLNVSGSPDAPDSINSKNVVSSIPTKDGKAGFLLEDGEIISQSKVTNAYNAQSVLSAVLILNSSKSDKEKALSLSTLGVDVATNNDLIDFNTGSNLAAGLEILNTANNWQGLDTKGRVVGSVQGVGNILNITDDIGISNIGGTLGAKAIPGIGAVAGIYTGVDQAIDVFENIGDLRKSDAKKFGAIGLGSAGASIGAGISVASAIATGATIGSAIPVAGTLIGAAVGAVIGFASGFFGSSKSKERMERDAFRDAFEKVGLTKLNERKMDMLELADGTMYHIGEEGFLEKQIYNPQRADIQLLKDRAKVNNKLLAYEVDYTNDLDYMTSLSADALSNFILQTNNERVKDMTAHLTNGATSNTNSREFNIENWSKSIENMRSMYKKVGINDFEQGIHLTTQLLDNNVINIDKANQFLQGLQMIFLDNDNSFKLASKLNVTR